jgi:prepilin peptidase CpaA
LFAVKIFGAGDAKLATVVAFWVGLQGIAVFLFSMALSGGVLGVIALYFIKKGVPVKWQKGWLKNLADGRADVPYAIAIFFGTVASFHHIGLI